MTTTTLQCADTPLPPAQGLPWNVAMGRACVACGKELTVGAVSRGKVSGRQGVHSIDTEVWSCPPGPRHDGARASATGGGAERPRTCRRCGAKALSISGPKGGVIVNERSCSNRREGEPAARKPRTSRACRWTPNVERGCSLFIGEASGESLNLFAPPHMSTGLQSAQRRCQTHFVRCRP